MLRVWEEINSLEDAQNGEEDDDSSMVVSPDAFAIACFQNGLYADQKRMRMSFWRRYGAICR